MKLKSRLEQIESSLQGKIQRAAASNDTLEVIAYAQHLERCNSLQRKFEELAIEVERLEALILEPLPPIQDPPATSRRSIADSRRIADNERDKFLESLRDRGYQVTREGRSNVVYTTRQGKLGVPFSRENERYPNRWFFGLPIDEYAIIVFICRHRSGQTEHYILPREVVHDNLRYFSRSRDSQLKFSIFRVGPRLKLAIPGRGRLDLTSYRENYGPFNY